MSEHELSERMKKDCVSEGMGYIDDVANLEAENAALKQVEGAAIEVDRIARLDPGVEEYNEWLTNWHKALDGLHALLEGSE